MEEEDRHPERSRGIPPRYLNGGTSGFLDFARNDEGIF
jgi:hypothetical protein